MIDMALSPQREIITATMKLFVFAVLFVVAVVAEEEETLVESESYPQQAYASSGHGQAYGAYGRKDASYGAHGHGYHGDHGRHGDKGYSAYGKHDVGGHKAYDAYGDHASKYGKYRNVGAYAQNRGAGYEKAYAYDKKAGHHDVSSDYGAKHGQYGVHDRAAHHNVGAYGKSGHDRYGSHDRYGGHGYGVRSHDSSAYGKHGNSHGQAYQQGPAYSHGY